MAVAARAEAPLSLTTPGTIGTLTLPNRIFVTAMGVSLAEDDGSVGQD